MSKCYLLFNPPNPPGRNVYKAFAGGYGTLGSVGGDNLIPQFLIYMSSALKNEGIDCRVLDAQALDYSTGQILEEVRAGKPDVLVSWLSLPTLASDLRLLDEIKDRNPETFILGFGTVCRALADEILVSSKIDALLTGYYPYYNAVLALNEGLNGESDEGVSAVPGIVYRGNNGGIERGRAPLEEDIDKLNLDVYKGLPVTKYLSTFPDNEYKEVQCIPILTGVGCPHGCGYCPYPVGYGRKIKFKSVENILREIEFLMENYGINGFVFREQAFTHDRERALAICDEIISRGLDIRWLVETRVDKVDEELLGKMAKAGCFRIHYGVETGDMELLEKKGKPGTKLRQIKEAFEATKRAGICAHAHVMVGFPEETSGSINNTIRLLKEIDPDNVNINIVTPYPGTGLFDNIKKAGLLISEDWSAFTSYDPVMKTDSFTPDEIKASRVRIKREFIKHKLRTDSKFRRHFIFKLPGKLRNRLPF